MLSRYSFVWWGGNQSLVRLGHVGDSKWRRLEVAHCWNSRSEAPSPSLWVGEQRSIELTLRSSLARFFPEKDLLSCNSTGDLELCSTLLKIWDACYTEHSIRKVTQKEEDNS